MSLFLLIADHTIAVVLVEVATLLVAEDTQATQQGIQAILQVTRLVIQLDIQQVTHLAVAEVIDFNNFWGHVPKVSKKIKQIGTVLIKTVPLFLWRPMAATTL